MPSLKEAVEQAQETQEIRDALNRALRALDKANATKNDLVEAVYRASRDAASALSIPPVKAPARDRRRGKPEIAVPYISDWQLGKLTPTYTSEVCAQRVQKFSDRIRRITDIQRADHPVKACHVWNLGDLPEAELVFPGQAYRIDASLFRQVSIDGPRILGGFLRDMLGHFDTVDLFHVAGNHTFGGSQRREYHPEDSADRMIVENTRSLLGNEKRLTIHDPTLDGERNWWAIDRMGEYSCLLFHGQQIKGGFAGFPWYGLGRMVLRWNKAIGPFTDVALGHFHTLAEVDINGIMARANGSTESTNTYALEEMASMGRPSQRLMFVDPEEGIVTSEYKVWLE
jgi:hypothetical protein